MSKPLAARQGLIYVVHHLQIAGVTAALYDESRPTAEIWPIPSEDTLATAVFGRTARDLARANLERGSSGLDGPTIVALYLGYMRHDRPSQALLAAAEARKGRDQGAMTARLYLTPCTAWDEADGLNPGVVAAVGMATLLHKEVGGHLHRAPGTYAVVWNGLTLGVVDGTVVGAEERWGKIENRALAALLSKPRVFPLEGLNSGVMQLRHLLHRVGPERIGAAFEVWDQVVALTGQVSRRSWWDSSLAASPDWDAECDNTTRGIQRLFEQSNDWMEGVHLAISGGRERIKLIKEAQQALNEPGLSDHHMVVMAKAMLVPYVWSEPQFKRSLTAGGGYWQSGVVRRDVDILKTNINTQLALEEAKLRKKEKDLYATRNW